MSSNSAFEIICVFIFLYLKKILQSVHLLVK